MSDLNLFSTEEVAEKLGYTVDYVISKLPIRQ